MLIKVFGAAVQGIEATLITIEVNSSRGCMFYMVGLPDSAVKESHQRILSALQVTGYKMPTSNIVINMAPADIRKEGSSYDLPLAIARNIQSAMAESTILTGQFVRISQTPASIGERIIALIIDYVLIGFYIFSTVTVLSKLRLPSDFTMIFFLAVIYLPVLFYSFLCEMFNYGQSLGKRLMNIRVVKADGSVPSISSYLLRWLLFPIDGPITGGLGLLVALLTKNSQRMGDLAAGTMVIKSNT